VRRLPFRGAAGIGLVALCWPLSWTLPGLRTHLLFFPLWLGYVLLVDALVEVRAGSSILSRSRRDFVALFVASVPVWWVFEAFNQRLENWVYHGTEQISDIHYVVLASLSFSTVIPAVFETAELLGTFGWTHRFARGPRVPDRAWVQVVCFLVGAGMLALLLLRPRTFYPLLWLSLVFLLEPLCRWLGRRSLLSHLTGDPGGDWRPVVTLALGALACGFFWELWNYRSFPKWTYDTPGFDFWHVFEMPLPGYLGYLPFGLELYPMAHLILWWRPDVRLPPA
jgi:hypothetical protein